VQKLRLTAFLVVVFSSIVVNVNYSPQIMNPRPPVFNGADIAQNFEWRAMGVRMHSWWLYRTFPDSIVHHVGYVRPGNQVEKLKTGIFFSSWIDEELGLEVDDSLPPYDIEAFGAREELLTFAKHYSRIRCRDNQKMVKRDTCYYVVAWDEHTVGDSPTFVGVRTALLESGNSEYFLVEADLLKRLLGAPLESIPTIHDTEIH
jgi:hypothetical protein